ncbi:LysE family transporter [Pelagibacteraceae bacterium]|nr:LysE family transporter [Pelagibacteraceae bacterium]
MSFLFLGFITGLSLILAIGAQNIFVIEQGLKKNYIFYVCLICSISDFLLIFLGIFIFYYFQDFFTLKVEIILNLLLLIFLMHFIWSKIKKEIFKINIITNSKKYSFSNTIIKTLSFTFLNPHVYSDTLFFLGNFSKGFNLKEKLFFGLGASLSSFLFFFTIGYLSKYLSNYLNNQKVWKFINITIVFIMSFLTIYVLMELINLF